MTKLDKQTFLRDPVHGHIIVDDSIILALINTKEMQRLRRVKQLGTASFTFHGAEHSRFGHSVGVYEITRRIIDNFNTNYPKTADLQDGFDNEERLVALSAAVLHDIGHGAYSHTFEKIFNTNHENITREIITSPETDVNNVLSSVSSDFPQKVASVIDHTYPNKQVVQMISSQIDADRMDYLLRDAYMTGASYGKFDLDRILRVMRPSKKGIVFTSDGMHAVEDYLVSRYQMYQQVYFHPVSRSMEIILSNLLKRAKYLYQNDSNFPKDRIPLLQPFFEENPSLKDYLKIDDGVLNTYIVYFQDSNDKTLRDLADRFINRRPFKSVLINNSNRENITQMRNLIEQSAFDPEYFSAINDSFDLPYDIYKPESEAHKTPIEILSPSNEYQEISTISPLVNAFTGKLSGDERFFFPKEMLNQKDDELFSDNYRQFQKLLN